MFLDIFRTFFIFYNVAFLSASQPIWEKPFQPAIFEEGLRPLNDTEFRQEVEKGVTLVQFYKGEDGFLGSDLQRVSGCYKGRLKIAYVDVEGAPETARSRRIVEVPTLCLFKDGEELGRYSWKEQIDIEGVKKWVASCLSDSLNRALPRPLPICSPVQYLEDDTFRKGIEKGITLVDFYGEWCGPCRALAPILERVAQDVSGKAVIAKVDIDKAREITKEFQIRCVPTMILFKDGEEMGRLIGKKSAEEIKAFIEGGEI